MSAESPLLLGVAAGFVGLLGALIKYAGAVRLIAGYDPDRVTDEAGLAAFIGTNTLYVAVLVLSVAVVEYTDPFDGTAIVWIVFTVGVIGLTARMIVGSRRYETSE
ncbi:DUF3784 domain-containing protein [Natronorubrum sulfidifaciens]|uniref:DUF3784 domain-containing protein n=1 Tax=Natronorubrum sulfidifaciens JCM 14089 TaxID=1230460 RepID=L9WIV5_9EURY|nr:DUF3784 domain-containing protein [Natronorubrum sulfidifaciens]ELY48278.1 hypothetical protein C495_02350 [Natronorubrum sulfidifaciens JCM 14089]